MRLSEVESVLRRLREKHGDVNFYVFDELMAEYNRSSGTWVPKEENFIFCDTFEEFGLPERIVIGL